jgi:penicillin-binding protein 2
MNMHEAIVQSCDVYFYQLALSVGIDSMEHGMREFGFGAPTGLDISGENPGVVPSREWKAKQFKRREDQVWFPGETVITGIGQGFTLVTPVQLAHAGAVLAARGKNYKPRLLIGTEDAISREVSWVEPTLQPGLEDVAAEHWQTIHDAMVGVTHETRGSARPAWLGTPYLVAGKTGTAQVYSIAQEENPASAKFDEANVDERLRDHGLFVAYAPAEAPRIAIGIVIENGGGGSRAAAPVARKIFDAYFAAEGYVASEP